MTKTTTTTTTTESQVERDRYRFEGMRYQIQSSPTTGPGWIVPQEPGLMTYPKDDTKEE